MAGFKKARRPGSGPGVAQIIKPSTFFKKKYAGESLPDHYILSTGRDDKERAIVARLKQGDLT